MRGGSLCGAVGFAMHEEQSATRKASKLLDHYCTVGKVTYCGKEKTSSKK